MCKDDADVVFEAWFGHESLGPFDGGVCGRELKGYEEEFAVVWMRGRELECGIFERSPVEGVVCAGDEVLAVQRIAVRREEVDAEKLNKEKEILRAQALNEGKPEKIVERMVEGRIEKYYKEVCLLEQPFVKDPDKTIKGLMGEIAKAAGAELDIVKFSRFERGEGIEKRKDDLAAEIAAMTK